MPLINSLSSAKILSILQEYKSGERPGTVMPQLAKGYSDEQLQIIANQLGTK
jgi:cytochrome c553